MRDFLDFRYRHLKVTFLRMSPNLTSAGLTHRAFVFWATVDVETRPVRVVHPQNARTYWRQSGICKVVKPPRVPSAMHGTPPGEYALTATFISDP